MSWKPDGEHEVDPCVYQDVEMHINATVIVSRCVRCGKVNISWLRTENTEDIEMTEDFERE